MNDAPNKPAETVMYRVSRYGGGNIEKVRVLNMTKEYATFIDMTYERPKERRERQGGRYFRTWEAARAMLVGNCEQSIERSKQHLHQLESKLGTLKLMKEPA